MFKKLILILAICLIAIPASAIYTTDVPYRVNQNREGRLFGTDHLAETIADNAITNITFTVGSSRDLNSDLIVGGGIYMVQIYEGSVVSVNGTAVTPNNRNLASSQTTSQMFYSSVTTNVTDGTLVNSGLSTASAPYVVNRIFDAGIVYSIKATNISGAAAPLGLTVDFSEE